jgi:hypothetical protein
MRLVAIVILAVLAPSLAWSQNVVTRAPTGVLRSSSGTSALWDNSTDGGTFRAYVDGVLANAIVPVCAGAYCTAPLLGARAQLDAPGRHFLTITRVVNNLESAPSNAIEVTNRAATCDYQTPGTTTIEQRAFGSPLQGVIPFNKVAGDNYAAARIGQLRLAGWRVEWQLFNPTNTFVVAVCLGVPQ